MGLLSFTSKELQLQGYVSVFYTTNVEANRNTTGWQGNDISNPQSFQNKITGQQKGHGICTRGFTFFLPPCPADEKNTRQSLKHWIQV